MEEKERYSLEEFDDIDWELAITDNKLGKSLTSEDVKKLLNQQSKYIEELKSLLNKKLQKNYQAFKQAQIELAISELKKLESELVDKVSPAILSYNGYVEQVFAQINNQIKELKGEE